VTSFFLHEIIIIAVTLNRDDYKIIWKSWKKYYNENEREYSGTFWTSFRRAFSIQNLRPIWKKNIRKRKINKGKYLHISDVETLFVKNQFVTKDFKSMANQPLHIGQKDRGIVAFVVKKGFLQEFNKAILKEIYGDHGRGCEKWTDGVEYENGTKNPNNFVQGDDIVHNNDQDLDEKWKHITNFRKW